MARDMSSRTSESIASLESLDDVARRELGETPEVKQTALEELRQLISGEPSLNCPTDDDFLVKFLRARKYDTKSAFKNVKKYFQVRRDRPELFEDLTPSCIPFDVVCRRHQLLTVSRHTDPLGRMVLLVKIGSWNTEICTLNDFFRVGIALGECFLLRQDFQVRGIVVIVDLKGLNVYHLSYYTPSVIRTLVSLVQDCFPLRLKKVYVINNPPIFDFLFAITKTFLKAKLAKRIQFLGYNLTELHQLVPDDVISEEHEGTNESFDYDQLERELKAAENFFEALSSYGYRETLSTKMAPEPNGILAVEELSEDYGVFESRGAKGVVAKTERLGNSTMPNDRNGNFREGFTLPGDLRDIAQQELGETPAVKEQALYQLRELILGEPLLDCPTDEDFLVKFLRARKYDPQNAFKNVKKYFKVRRDNPQMFGGLTPCNVPFNDACRKHRLVTLSRKTDPKGRAVLKFRTGGWNTDICSLDDFFRICIVHTEHMLLQEEFQIRGVVAVLDIKGLSLFHVAHYTPSVIRTFITLVQDCLPVRTKAVYIINNPALFDLLFTIAKPFMKAKLVNRIRFFGYDWEELHSLVPDDVIPEEHGGTNESYDFDTIEEELKSEEKFFEKINAYGYRKKAKNGK
ncbi:uncharacterized protein LOC142578239 [Dermacentor variabilis]|uniref:uncharacterized protein LOC142578239 n=1 Tax=Dermacentor variabilis TaxID=34621 RepID=UPI003F5BD7A5